MSEINFTEANASPAPGSAGLPTQVPGQAVTVSSAAAATGGIGGSLEMSFVDQQLFSFQSDDTPLMTLMLQAKRVDVTSPEVAHYMLDEATSILHTAADMPQSTGFYTTLSLPVNESSIPRPYSTLLVCGVDGYAPDGVTPTPGRDLMLFVSGRNDNGLPLVRACNGKKQNASDTWGVVPAIPAGTKVVILSNALYETQKEVDPDLIVPYPTTVYLQKRGMNQVVSDYFEHQKKNLPFAKAVIAEQAITNFKKKGNRTLWASRASKFEIETPKVGVQTVYTTEGLRWQFKREMVLNGPMTVEKVILLAKLFFTGEDVPKNAILLAGKTLLERIQCVDYSKHPEVQITTKINSLGWTVTNFHTVFGDIEIKREPTLDALGWDDCGALIGEGRLVHYVYRTESDFEQQVDGEEAKRSGMLVWDGLALKGSCHMWINGGTESSNPESIIVWNYENFAPENDGLYHLMCTVADISENSGPGQLWRLSSGIWSRVN